MCSCFLELGPLKKYLEVKTASNKNTMETCSSFQKPVTFTFMYFWLNYCNENHHIERIPVAVKNINQ